MWNAIPFVTAPLGLVAFLAAAYATFVRFSLRHKLDEIKTAPESERGSLIEQTLDRWGIPVADLPNEDRYALLLKILNTKRINYLVSAVLTFAFFSGCVIAWAYFHYLPPTPEPLKVSRFAGTYRGNFDYSPPAKSNLAPYQHGSGSLTIDKTGQVAGTYRTSAPNVIGINGDATLRGTITAEGKVNFVCNFPKGSGAFDEPIVTAHGQLYPMGDSGLGGELIECIAESDATAGIVNLRLTRE